MTRNELLNLSDEDLIRLCEIDFFKATGPGGQKKNKTESAVRLTHRELGVTASASEDRQQSINRSKALKRLRLQIALECREAFVPWEGQWNMNPKNPQYPLFAAFLIDTLEEKDWQVSAAAEAANVSTGRFIKLLGKSDQLWQYTNRQRQIKGYKPLKKN